MDGIAEGSCNTAKLQLKKKKTLLERNMFCPNEVGHHARFYHKLFANQVLGKFFDTLLHFLMLYKKVSPGLALLAAASEGCVRTLSFCFNEI